MMIAKIQPGSRIYFDTNVLIYVLEDSLQFSSLTENLLKSIEKSGSIMCGCELLLTELLAQPFRNNDDEKIAMIEQFLRGESGFEMMSLDQVDFRNAARLRAKHNLKLADALHLASTLKNQCDLLVTNDKKLADAAGDIGLFLGDLEE